MSARQTAKYGVAAIVVAMAVIAAAVLINPAGPTSSRLSSTGSQTSSGSGTTGGSATSGSGIGGAGTLNIYLTDAPPGSQTLKYLLVNVSSVELDYQSGISTTTTTASTSSSTVSATSVTSGAQTESPISHVFTVPASAGKNVNLTSLQGRSTLLGTTNPPAGNVTSVTINITGAKAFYADGSTEQLRVVADGKLMVPIHFSVQANGSTDLTIDITPNTVHVSSGDVLTPVIHVTAVGKSDGATTTQTGSVDESQQ